MEVIAKTGTGVLIQATEREVVENETDRQQSCVYGRVGGNMQTFEIYKWAKAELERYKKSSGYSDISAHYCSFIECELLPKLEESLHTSNNSARAEICPHYGRGMYVGLCTCAGKLSPVA